MRVTRFTYNLKPPTGERFTKTVEVVEDSSPLARAVEAEAERNPERVICGAELNGDIVFVGPVEGL